MTIIEQKIEMLLLSPEHIGKGQGKKLVKYVIQKLKAIGWRKWTEQKAIKFYSKFGFVAYERNEKDDQGDDYPLLRMELKK